MFTQMFAYMFVCTYVRTCEHVHIHCQHRVKKYACMRMYNIMVSLFSFSDSLCACPSPPPLQIIHALTILLPYPLFAHPLTTLPPSPTSDLSKEDREMLEMENMALQDELETVCFHMFVDKQTTNTCL